MRSTRLIVAVITTAALALPTASLSTASAVTTKTSVSQKASASHQAAPKKLYRTFRHTRIVNITPTRLQMRTQVVNYPFQRTFLQRKVCRGCVWTFYDRKFTRGDGYVFYRVGYPARGKWYWRIGTPARGIYRVSYSPVWNTFAN